MVFHRWPRQAAVALLCAFPLAAAWGAAAVTGTQFAVSESGAATLSVPIQIPRGIAGMEPQLSLSYSSGAGNGLVGLGWMLSGPSTISRCGKSRALDGVRTVANFVVGDRYCLDGQRLVFDGADSDTTYGTVGSRYWTERDTFSRITAVGPTYNSQVTVPSGFKVETKAGLILDFGLDANSRVLTNFGAGLGTTTINRWMLQRISDRNGNFVEFFYCAGVVSSDGKTCNAAAWTGSTVLHYIRYTNRNGVVNGSLSVVFGYESRPDRIQTFHAGSSSRQTQRLSRIETYRDFVSATAASIQPGLLVRGYDIVYDAIEDASNQGIRATNTSRIKRIQERAATGATLPAIEFTLAPDVVMGQVVAHRPSATTATPPPPAYCTGMLAYKTDRECP